MLARACSPARASSRRSALLFDSSRSVRELGLQYSDIRVAFAEAIDFITSHGLPEVPADQQDAAQGLLGANEGG